LAFSGLAVETLSGSWDTDVTIDLTQTDFSEAISLSSKLTVDYKVGDWTFTSITTLADYGWKDQDFNVAGVLGAFELSAALDLNPLGTAYYIVVPTYTWAWDHWVLGAVIAGYTDPLEFMGDLDFTAKVNIAGVSFELDGDLKRSSSWDPGLDLFVDFTASGVAGAVTVEVTVSFGDDESYKVYTVAAETGLVTAIDYYGMAGICDLDWAGADITVGFPFCCVALEAEIVFDCAGLDEIVFSFGDLMVPNLPWLTIDGELTFDLVHGKTFELTPTFDFGATVCFDLYWGIDGWEASEFGGQGFSLDSIYLDGIGIECTIGGVTFEALTFWGPAIYGAYEDDFPGILSDFDTEYYEAYKISTTDDACCGPFGFSFAVYFDDVLGVVDTNLFDVDLFIATVELEVASQFTFDMGLNVDVDGGFTEWTVGFLVTW
jgi:hypothetical protein